MGIIETILEETHDGKDIRQCDIQSIKYRINKEFAELGNEKGRKEIDRIIMRDELIRYLFRDPNAPVIKQQPKKERTSYWIQDRY